MSRRIEYSASATRTLRRIDRTTSARIRDKIALLADDPQSLRNNISPLRGGGGLKRLRVGDWRVIYSETLIILSIVKVAPRGSAYEE